MPNRLTPTQTDLKPEYADDYFTLTCMNIENSLLQMEFRCQLALPESKNSSGWLKISASQNNHPTLTQ